MRIAFIVLALALSAVARADIYLDEYLAENKDPAAHAARKPKCLSIRFTGVASAGRERDIDDTLAAKDVEDTLARNPINCRFPGGGLQESCDGVAHFKNHKGRIVNWTKRSYYIVSPVDFNNGRRDIRMYVSKKDTTCAK